MGGNGADRKYDTDNCTAAPGRPPSRLIARTDRGLVRHHKTQRLRWSKGRDSDRSSVAAGSPVQTGKLPVRMANSPPDGFGCGPKCPYVRLGQLQISSACGGIAAATLEAPTMAVPVSWDVAPADHFPLYPANCDLIRAQTERIVASPPFRKSKRYPRFLQFIVEQTLSGNAELLKERTLGVEVFDRAPDYDVAVDPIVRIAAGEIRKRLAQYYVDDDHHDELRIELPPGTYVPRFCAAPVSLSSPLSGIPLPTERPADPKPDRRLWAARLRTWLPGTVAILGLAVILATLFHRATAIDEFWEPLFSSSAPLVCLGTPTHSIEVAELPQIRTGVRSNDFLTLGDVLALNLISPLLAAHGKKASILSAATTSFSDLQGHPVILVGARSNQWTMRAMQFLRFHIPEDAPDGVVSIRDRQHPLHPLWTVDFKLPFDQIPREYGIVARYYDPVTEQPTFVVAGTGVNGTLAAAEFLTTPAYMKTFRHNAPLGWQKRNIEIIVETDMINGACGPPHILTTYFW